MIGVLVGALFTGMLSDRYGRLRVRLLNEKKNNPLILGLFCVLLLHSNIRNSLNFLLWSSFLYYCSNTSRTLHRRNCWVKTILSLWSLEFQNLSGLYDWAGAQKASFHRFKCNRVVAKSHHYELIRWESVFHQHLIFSLDLAWLAISSEKSFALQFASFHTLLVN